MTVRLVTPAESRAVAREMQRPCLAELLCPGDGRAAVCKLTQGDHIVREFHEDTTGTRMWRETGPDDYAVMMKPGSPPLGEPPAAPLCVCGLEQHTGGNLSVPHLGIESHEYAPVAS